MKTWEKELSEEMAEFGFTLWDVLEDGCVDDGVRIVVQDCVGCGWVSHAFVFDGDDDVPTVLTCCKHCR